MSSEKRPKKQKHADFWRACRFLGPYRGLVVTAIVCAFASGVFFTGGLSVLGPILKVLVEGDTVPGWIDAKIASYPPDSTVPWYLRIADPLSELVPTHPVAAIALMFGFVTVLAVCGNVIKFFAEYFSDKAAISAVNDVRKRLYDRVLHIPLAYFGMKGTSDVTSRLVNDSVGLQEGFKVVLGRAIQEPINAGLALGLALFIDWRLTLFIVVFVPVMYVMLRKFGKKMRRASRAALQTNSNMLGQIEGSLTGIRVVKSVGAERFERRRYRRIMDTLLGEQLKMARYEAISGPVLETTGMLAAGAVLIVATYLVLVERTLSQAWFFVVVACLVSIGEAMRRLSKVNNVLQRANAAAARIWELMDIPTERDEMPRPARVAPVDARLAARPQVRPLPPLQRDITFENVSFTYPGAGAPALAGVDLTVQKGQSVAIVGRNGSGKTTLLALLPRFYDPQRGRVLIDGTDLRHVSLRSLRRQIGVVTQEAIVFPGTIAQNIAYGSARPIQTIRDKIEDAARRAHAHEFILEKPLGYDTPLDGLGSQLSGGQRQRLNIARAILRETPILILDEATSQVDAESEHLIQQAIESLMHERTTFVIAHRFSTITSADTIVVMDRGTIVGQGQHDELLRTCETYKQLYERQLFTPAT
jgi:ABC-type multidrug transport system fused ATPase/permease subunit